MYLVCLVAFAIATALPFAAPDDVQAPAPDRVTTPTYDDCAEIYGVLYWISALQEVALEDGVYDIKPETSAAPFPAYCDMTTAEGGWTVIQRRFNGSLNFDRSWADYEDGFGDVDGEYWLGLEKIHKLVSQAPYELYVEIQDWEGNSAYAKYSTFGVEDASSNYRLTIGGYSGDASDCMVERENLNGMQFSTKDRDNDMDPDVHCAQAYSNAWWYDSCSWSGLNGPYFRPEHYRRETGLGVFWMFWKGRDNYYSLKATKMMVRPADFRRRARPNH
ncbi:angiopoietin-related protein 1-like [Branchiostoma lanceolatum]|uniref:angiopoietin-related protein 1-like n=1 Tax=Branchiostoma lanceolatum TaxID=7740 RepID=UPI003456BF5D